MEEINEQATVTHDEEKVMVDPKLYKQASRRVAFKSHVFIYILINLLLWVVWAFIFRKPDDPAADTTFFKCILFVSIVWFIILLVHYVIVYRGNKSLIDKELKKLQKEINEKPLEEINK